MITTVKTIESNFLSRLRSGDEDAFAEVVAQYTAPMLRLAKSFVHDGEEAADVVQEAFMSAFKALDRFAGDCSIGTWLHRIVVNACLMNLRSRSRRRTVSIQELLPEFDETGHHVQPVTAWAENPYEKVAGSEARAQVRRCIEQLPDDYRSVIVLRDIDGLDTEQTAEILQIAPGAVKTRLHRARQALRTLLTPFMTDPAQSSRTSNRVASLNG